MWLFAGTSDDPFVPLRRFARGRAPQLFFEFSSEYSPRKR